VVGIAANVKSPSPRGRPEPQPTPQYGRRAHRRQAFGERSTGSSGIHARRDRALNVAVAPS
jgi:hypothetical protein